MMKGFSGSSSQDDATNICGKKQKKLKTKKQIIFHITRRIQWIEKIQLKWFRYLKKNI
jgi:hypothetical protein